MNTSVKLAKAVQLLRTYDPDMSMAVLVTLLALADGEEVEVRDLQKRLDLSASSLNRALTTLGDRHWRKDTRKPGLGLVDQRISAEDRRQRIASLTEKGRTVISTLEDILS